MKITHLETIALRDFSQAASFDLGLCRAILAAYAHHSRGLLSAVEAALVYDAAHIIPLELGLRFLTDHLEGDRWFRVAEHGDNLRRALVQLSLVEDIERKRTAIQAIVVDCFGCGAPPRTGPTTDRGPPPGDQ